MKGKEDLTLGVKSIIIVVYMYTTCNGGYYESMFNYSAQCNGNNYLIATHMQEVLKQNGVDARLYRVEDEDLHIWANRSDAANDYYEEIQALPVANESTLEKSQMIILGKSHNLR